MPSERIIKVAIIVSIVILLIVIVKRNKTIAPISIANGLQYRIPYSKKDKFKIKGLGKGVYGVNDLERLRLKHKDIDTYSVFYDNDLRSDFSIGYMADNRVRNPKYVHIHLRGDLDPKVVKGYYN